MGAPGPMTNFPNGVTSWGIPQVNMALARMAAQDAKMFWVDPRDGAGGGGRTVKNAFTTVTALNAAMTDESGDCAIYIGHDGGTGSSSRDTATITWSNSGCTLLGACAPVRVSQRCRIAPSTTFAGPVLTVSGNNNVFANFQIWQGHNAASTALSVTGDRNYFWNIHVAGIGHATAGDDAASESLLLSGSENTFEHCTIGIDTIARSAATAEIRCATGAAATRNTFRDCDILCFADAAGALWLDLPGAGSIDRYVMFDNCRFWNAIDSTATTMTVGANIHASAGGTARWIGGTTMYGATDWTNTFGNTSLGSYSGDAQATAGIAANGS